jgi:hypothetical protein
MDYFATPLFQNPRNQQMSMTLRWIALATEHGHTMILRSSNQPLKARFKKVRL